ncbi:GIY-YIG nuclease family protein [Marinigracilibium pacificum]|uniref:GIY-YIG nuclease family protein n=1 Tax=Marinigracilibium pacificum TaxID=2729599 RepID=A0A848IUM4_9BACT|nr:GIY-YIG nuclease family protein [Marinigracilibium pacificum]NMM48203.1 GIY-YIG nuclease family protein [Marinigracilibium pacificum]
MKQVYILYSPGLDIYYKGQTSDLDERLKYHNSGYETSTSKGVPWTLVWSTAKATRQEAMLLEKKLKNLSWVRLEKFMSKYSEGLSESIIKDRIIRISQ